MSTKLNVRFLCLILGVAVVLGVGVRQLHAFHSRRNAPVLLEMADREEAEAHPGQALRLLARYLLLVPEDVEVEARHGLLFARLARTPEEKLQAYLTLGQVLREAPQRVDVRRVAIDLALQPSLRRYS